ncbi:MAG: NAD(+)/NADH kinase [Anaerotignaceae bacterium]
MKRIGILPNGRKDENFEATKTLIKFLQTKRCKPMITEYVANETGFLDLAQKDEYIYKESDFIITLGGDGTILSASKRAAKYDTPILGINFGHLGFLTDSSREGFTSSVEKVLNGDYTLEKRMMLRAEIYSQKEGRKITGALNEVAISRGSMVDVGVFVNDEFIVDFFGDGILVSTPTGSTAYNLAAGGPILKSDADVVAITPICPHKLHARSIVVGGEDVVKLKINRYTRQRIYVVIDGQNNCTLESEDYILITKSKYAATIIKTGDIGFYGVLREKMFARGGRVV